MKYLASGESLTAVADAIREKGGTSEPLEFYEGFVEAIENIPSGGGVIDKKDVNFYDCDGTLLYSYTQQQFEALNDMPELPTSDGLVCQGWNISLQDAKTYVSSHGSLNIGATYITDNGKTRLWFYIDPNKYTERMTVNLRLRCSGSNGVNVEWGDGETQVIGYGYTTWRSASHTYSTSGLYKIQLQTVNANDELFLGGESSSYGVWGSTDDSTENRINGTRFIRVEIGSGVTTIGSYAFIKCDNLKIITIPNTVTSIGGHSFEYCYELQFIAIPHGVQSIGDYAFSTCRKLTKISFPTTLLSIGGYAFQNCSCLSQVLLPEQVSQIGVYGFYNCCAIYDMILPAALTVLEEHLFDGCSRINNLIIPDGVTNIKTWAITRLYALTTLTIPSNVANLGTASLSYLCGLTGYHFKRTTPPQASNPFYSMVNGCKIYVPYSDDHSILAAYRSASGFSAFSSWIVEEPAP